MTAPPPDPLASAISRRRATTAGAVAVLLTLLIFLHVPGLNGTWYWQWKWIRVPLPDTLPFILLAALPALAAVYFYPRRINAAVGLVLLAISLFAMQYACARRGDDPLALGRLTAVVGGAASNSYFRSAGVLLANGLPDQPRWLSTYPSLMHDLYLHARNKPPGLVLLHFPVIRQLGFNELAATATGLYMSLLTPLTVPAVYLLLRTLTRDRTAAFLGAALLPFTPAVAMFFPTWDAIFPVLTALLIVPWVRAVDTGRSTYAVLFGLALAVVTFFTFNLLVLGLFLAGYAIADLLFSPTRKPTFLKLLRLSVISLATCAAAYLLFHSLTGYDPLATLRAGIANQAELDRTFLKRPYPITIPFDVLDFLLGTGWLPAILLLFLLRPHPSTLRPQSSVLSPSSPRTLTILVVAQILILAVTGLLTVETARVWTFLIPLLLVPAAFELHRWLPRHRLVIYLSLLLVLIAVNQNMRFLLA